MLNLRAVYAPETYHAELGPDKPGYWEHGQAQTVTIIAVIPTDADSRTELLAVDGEGHFIEDSISRFTYTGTGWL